MNKWHDHIPILCYTAVLIVGMIAMIFVPR